MTLPPAVAAVTSAVAEVAPAPSTLVQLVKDAGLSAALIIYGLYRLNRSIRELTRAVDRQTRTLAADGAARADTPAEGG